MTLLKRLFFAVAITIISPISALADEAGAKFFIDNLAHQALVTIKSKNTEAVKAEKLSELVKQSVDVEWIAKFVLGRYGRTINDEQRVRYNKAYGEFLSKNYTSKFNEYTTAKFKMIGSRSDNPNEYIVETEITTANDPSISVKYRVAERTPGNYKIVDMIVEGISLLTTQRSEFNSVISRNGIEGFIKLLTDRAAAQTKK